MEYYAPQWVDFVESSSPQIPMQDYFDKEHIIHESKVEPDDFAVKEERQNDLHVLTDSCINEEAQQDLNVIKGTPIKVISPKYRNKKAVTEQTTYDQVLSDAMRKLELYKKPSKNRDVQNKSIQEPKIFKTPNMPTAKLSRSVGYRSVVNKSVQPATMSGSAKLNKEDYTLEKRDISVHTKKASVSCSLFKQDETCVKDDTYKKKDDVVNDFENKKDEEYNEKNKIALHNKSEESIDDDNIKEEKNDVVDAMNKKCQMLPNKQHRAAVLTWQNGRRSLNRRRLSNQYISMAEAVSRFQTDTPKRFRTRSNKTLAEGASHNASKPPISNYRMKHTIPVSPALISKTRTRAVTALSQEERELEDMKKHKIKANPVPLNILRGSVRPVSKLVTSRKPTATMTMATTKTAFAESSSSSSAIQQPEKLSTTTSVRLKSPVMSYHDKASRNTVTKVLVTDPTGIIVEREEITFFGVPKDTGATKNVTRVIPFSFEARDKNLLMKREQRLKNLQEAYKAKTEFHARPAPSFSKSMTALSTVKQQQCAKKSLVQLRQPFNLYEQDKNLSKKKEELVKQMPEKDKRSRVFRANPAPVFKPVMVRGVSKEHLPTKEKTAKTEKKQAADRHDDQENEEPNIVAPEKTQESKYTRKVKNIADGKGNVEPSKSKGREMDATKTILSLELNTDKRARERREFDERVKRKEIEDGTRLQEENKKRLEQEKLLKTELRKLAEVKAKPMPIYKPFAVAKATKPLTHPQSPAFASKLKSKQA